ncbi:hypothetical protein CVT26_004710 [Gymnopilus dilepis]|uniref:Uncharacterized protein n=1 Tax=Gymnopilus dilepis TaxID=231916 RepID=A0A409XZ73_9AGAR|nr:hypothetical protein CVT26_004710 [Gymnopilus dilepis]
MLLGHNVIRISASFGTVAFSSLYLGPKPIRRNGFRCWALDKRNRSNEPFQWYYMAHEQMGYVVVSYEWSAFKYSAFSTLEGRPVASDLTSCKDRYTRTRYRELSAAVASAPTPPLPFLDA